MSHSAPFRSVPACVSFGVDHFVDVLLMGSWAYVFLIKSKCLGEHFNNTSSGLCGVNGEPQIGLMFLYYLQVPFKCLVGLLLLIQNSVFNSVAVLDEAVLEYLGRLLQLSQTNDPLSLLLKRHMFKISKKKKTTTCRFCVCAVFIFSFKSFAASFIFFHPDYGLSYIPVFLWWINNSGLAYERNIFIFTMFIHKYLKTHHQIHI